MSPTDETSPPPQIRRGLEGVIAGDTHISHVDGKRCQLIYRGYNIDELIGKTSYEEVSHLLLSGTLPTRQELKLWQERLIRHRRVEPQILGVMDGLSKNAGPMAILRTAVSELGLYDSKADSEVLEDIRGKAVRTIAKSPTIVAAIGRACKGEKPIEPDPTLGHAANFLYMLHGEKPTDEQAKALDTYFILLAEHGFNASTFAARTVTGTKSDYYSAMTGAVGTLKGPLHGAANRKAMEMLLEIGSVDRVQPYVQKTVADHKRFMGFGHRVYKGEDPRAKHLKKYAKSLADAQKDTKWFEICEELKDAVWRAKKLYINVDYYSAPLLHYLGIPTELFTTMFACSRSVGWSAHIIEQWLDNRLIRPLAHYLGPHDLKFIPLDKRQAV